MANCSSSAAATSNQRDPPGDSSCRPFPEEPCPTSWEPTLMECLSVMSWSFLVRPIVRCRLVPYGLAACEPLPLRDDGVLRVLGRGESRLEHAHARAERAGHEGRARDLRPDRAAKP